MWSFLIRPRAAPHPEVLLCDTLSGKRPFTKNGSGPVTVYSCGPTVYGPQHIGNLRAAVFSDTVARTLRAAGYEVKRVTNITDVGHLVGDGDEGEDKMAVGAKRDNTTPEEIAARYTTRYLEDIQALNIDTKDIRFPRATEYIDEQIAMIAALMKKGLAYSTSDGVYFATENFPDYGQLGNVRNVALKAGIRVAQGEKRSEHDFVLWRKAKPNDLQQWDSPWGSGNPGWSIECSAMATTLLGTTIDIHTGGQDHIQVHHNNEIAQSEGATGKKPFVRYWLHNAFLTIGGEKISKSLGNTYTLEDVRARAVHPLALRYLFLQAHYRTPLSFSWESLEAAHRALLRLWDIARKIRRESQGVREDSHEEVTPQNYIFNDLDTPSVLAALWSEIDSSKSSPRKRWTLLEYAEQVLGLSLTTPPEEPVVLSLTELPQEIQVLAKEREEARATRDFARADELRIHVRNRGYHVDDTPSGQVFTPLRKD